MLRTADGLDQALRPKRLRLDLCSHATTSTFLFGRGGFFGGGGL